MKYRKKPVEVEAREFSGGAVNAADLVAWIMRNGAVARWSAEQDACESVDGTHVYPSIPEGLSIDTLEGTMTASCGDYIIRGVQGEFYPCKPDIFDATYEAAK